MGARVTGQVITERVQGRGPLDVDGPFVLSSMRGALLRQMRRGLILVDEVNLRPGIEPTAELAAYQRAITRGLVRREDVVDEMTEFATRMSRTVQCTFRQISRRVGGIMTKNLAPGEEGSDLAQPVKARLARELEQARERQIVDAMQGVLTDCYGEPASLRHPVSTTITYTAAAVPGRVPADVPRHLRDAPHYRRIEHRGGWRRIA